MRNPEFKVGHLVFRSGRSGEVVAVNDDGTYDVRLADGEVVRDWAHNLAFRA